MTDFSKSNFSSYSFLFFKNDMILYTLTYNGKGDSFMNQEKIDRINELARKSKAVSLTQDELKEQARLRREYIDAYKASLRSQIHSIKVVDSKGNDVTPEKLKEQKGKYNN